MRWKTEASSFVGQSKKRWALLVTVSLQVLLIKTRHSPKSRSLRLLSILSFFLYCYVIRRLTLIVYSGSLSILIASKYIVFLSLHPPGTEGTPGIQISSENTLFSPLQDEVTPNMPTLFAPSFADTSTQVVLCVLRTKGYHMAFPINHA
jgi:hypothetical protein